MEQACQQQLCRSIFKDGTSETTSQTLTEVWIKMINEIENHKAISGETNLK